MQICKRNDDSLKRSSSLLKFKVTDFAVDWFPRKQSLRQKTKCHDFIQDCDPRGAEVRENGPQAGKEGEMM